ALIFLGLAGLIQKRPDPVAFVLGGLVIFTLPLVVGAYPHNPAGSGQLMTWVFDHVPIASIFRNTYKFAELTTFAATALAAATLQSLLRSKPRRAQISAIALATALASMIVISYPL